MSDAQQNNIAAKPAPLLVRQHLSFPPIGRNEPWGDEARAAYADFTETLRKACQFDDHTVPTFCLKDFVEILPFSVWLCIDGIKIPLLVLLLSLIDVLNALGFLLPPRDIKTLWSLVAKRGTLWCANLYSKEMLDSLFAVTSVRIQNNVSDSQSENFRPIELYQRTFLCVKSNRDDKKINCDQ